METVLQDFRYAARMLIRMRGAALVSILTLTLGVGATTMIFSVVYAALLRPLPFPDAGRLAALYTTRSTAREGLQRLRWSIPEIDALGSRLSALEEIGSFTSTNINLTSHGDPEQIFGEMVSPGYLRTLQVTAQIGRIFRAEEDTALGAHPVALVSARLWHRRLGSDPAVLGRTISINQVPLTIVGVLPDGFAGVSNRAEIWMPRTMAPLLTYADYLTTPQHFASLVGRLKPGMSFASASAELAALAPRVVVGDSAPAAEPVTWGATIVPLNDARIDAAQRRSGLLLLTAVACVLLITCVNVASVLLARARARRREIAVRLAIGSSRVRIVRQLLTESLLLAAIGGACGTLAAVWAVDALALPAVLASASNNYSQLAAFAAPRIDRAVLLFALAVTVGTSVLFGLAPALESSRPDLVGALKEDGRSGGGRGHLRVLAALVVTEMALAVLLLAGAGLLIKSFAEMQALRVGFVTDNVVTFWINPPASRYKPTDGPTIVERLLTRIQQQPGVVSAAVNRCTPFALSCARTTIFFPGQERGVVRPPVVGRHYVSADYFRTLGIPLREGRVLTELDRIGRPPVAVASEAAARRFWPGESAIGKRVWFGSSTGFTDPKNPVEIVGVVGDVKYGAADQAVLPDFYTSYLQFAYPDTMIMVKTDRGLGALMPALRGAVAAVDAGLPIYDVQTLDERIGQTLARPRYNATVLGLFAAAALLLAAVGVYGVMAYSVSFRLHEIGVRLALGANARQVLALVLGDGARLAGLGAAIGVAAAIALARLMRTLLFGVAPADPGVLAGVVIVMVVVALLAAFLPARRASTVDPMIVLRSE